MSLIQFDNYLVDFSRLEAIEATGCKCRITEVEKWALSLLDLPSVCEPQYYGRSKRGKIESLHLDQIHSPGLSPLAFALCACTFVCMLRSNSILDGITLPRATTPARYTAYADDISTLVTSSAEDGEFGREIQTYETVTGAMINRDKSVGWGLVRGKFVLSWTPSVGGTKESFLEEDVRDARYVHLPLILSVLLLLSTYLSDLVRALFCLL